jgi:DNA-binding XRE family transcriptional regulator
MKTYRTWEDLQHKSSPERLAEIDREAVAELDRIGFAALRKARELTQVELAEKLGIDQASVSAIENRSDLLLSTLTKYIRALGGEVEVRAVFPEATFNLEPMIPAEISVPSPSAKRKAAAGKAATPHRKTVGAGA